MSKYNEELPTTFVEIELGKFIKKHSDVLNTTVGETILIIQATTNYIDDLLQGVTSKQQRSLVVDSTMEHTKRLMLNKVGKNYEEQKIDQENAIVDDGVGQMGKAKRKKKAVHNFQSIRSGRFTG